MVHILNMTLYGSVAIIAVLIFRLVFAKVPKKVTFWFWFAALFRLVCPYNFGSVFSIFNIKSVELPVAAEQADTAMVLKDLPSKEPVIPHAAVNAVTEKVNDISTSAAPVRETVNINDLIFIIWIAGVIVLAGVMLYRSIKLLRRPGIKGYRASEIIEAGDINSSFVIGLIKPRIIIPSYLEGFEREYIIAHERVHIKNRDQFIKLLFFAVLCIHWFNPLVWLMYILASTDMEMRCDEEVIDRLGDGVKKDYCVSMVLHASEGYRHIGILDSAFTKKTIGGLEIKMRIFNLFKYKKLPVAVSALCLITVFSATWMLSSAASDIPQKPHSYSTDFTPDAKPEGIKAFKLSDKDNYLKEVRKIEKKIVKDPKGREIINYGEKGGIYIYSGDHDQYENYDTVKAISTDLPAEDFSGLAKRFNDDDHKVAFYGYSRDVSTEYLPELSLEISHKDDPLYSYVKYSKISYASFEDFQKNTYTDDNSLLTELSEVKDSVTQFGFSRIVYDPFRNLEIFRFNYYSDLDVLEVIENKFIQVGDHVDPSTNIKNAVGDDPTFEISINIYGNVVAYKYTKDSEIDYLPFCYAVRLAYYDNLSDFEATMNKVFIDEDGSYRLFNDSGAGLNKSIRDIFLKDSVFSRDTAQEISKEYGEDADRIYERMLKYSERRVADLDPGSVTSKATESEKNYRVDYRDANGNVLAYVIYDKDTKILNVYNLI